MRYLIALTMILAVAILPAQVGMNMNTPEGSVSMTMTGVPMNAPADGAVIDQIVDRLEKLEKEVHVKLTKLDKKKADKLMDEIYDLLSLLPVAEPVPVAETSASAAAASSSSSSSSSSGTANININITGMEGNPPPPPPHHDEEYYEDDEELSSASMRKVMPEGDFSDLVSRIKKESFSEGKIRVLRTAAKNYRFNCSQIVRLIDSYTFSEDKLEALRISYPDVADPKNNYKILDAFTFDTDKDEADRIINQ
jgi:hypothetical protein